MACKKAVPESFNQDKNQEKQDQNRLLENREPSIQLEDYSRVKTI